MQKQEFLNLFKGTVEIDPQRRGGQPVLKGTRFPISQIIAQIAEEGVNKFIEEFDYDPQEQGEDLKLFFACLSHMFMEPPIKE